MSRVGFIGTGHIASPMVRALASDGHEILVSRRNAEQSEALARAHDNVTVHENQQVVDGADIVFLCVRPHLAAQVIGPLTFRAGQQVVSVMAGVPMADLQTMCAPATDICMTIPLGYVEHGNCPLAVYPSRTTLEPLFGAANPVIGVASEEALNAHFAACAMVPGLLAMLEQGASWLATRTGNSEAAELYVTELVSGFLSAMERRPEALGTEKQALATEGTLSLMMVAGLEKGGALAAQTAAMDAIEERLLGKT